MNSPWHKSLDPAVARDVAWIRHGYNIINAVFSADQNCYVKNQSLRLMVLH